MLKILSADQIKSADAFTIEHEPVRPIDLMERACLAFAGWIVSRFSIDKSVVVIAGTGNNGADGLGIARILKSRGYKVNVWILRGGSESPEFVINHQRLDEVGTKSKDVSPELDASSFANCDVLVDALFGTGLSRALAGRPAEVIALMNTSNAAKVAVDLPSGLFADKHSDGVIFEADYSVSFQLPRLAFMFPENGKFVGEWHLEDIRLNKEFIKQSESKNFYITRKGVEKKMHTRGKFSNKGNFGKALLISGSYGKMGACILSARAALRSGLGLLTLHVPQTGTVIVQTAVPEAMVSVDRDVDIFTEVKPTSEFTVIGIGPGIGTDDETLKGLIGVMKLNKPMVIDADALNLIGTHRDLFKSIPKGSILTPHPKEFERLTSAPGNDFERLEMQKTLALELGSVVIVKGAHTSIALPNGKVYFNSTGNPGMAKGGSGDVLTGILTGLLSQGYSAEDAAVIGVYLHGLAGDLGVAQKGQNSLIATDLIDFLPLAFKKTQVLAQ